MQQSKKAESIRTEERITLYRKKSKEADRWAAGYGGNTALD